jgi:hypothetical protein
VNPEYRTGCQVAAPSSRLGIISVRPKSNHRRPILQHDERVFSDPENCSYADTICAEMEVQEILLSKRNIAIYCCTAALLLLAVYSSIAFDEPIRSLLTEYMVTILLIGPSSMPAYAAYERLEKQGRSHAKLGPLFSVGGAVFVSFVYALYFGNYTECFALMTISSFGVGILWWVYSRQPRILSR